MQEHRDRDGTANEVASFADLILSASRKQQRLDSFVSLPRGRARTRPIVAQLETPGQQSLLVTSSEVELSPLKKQNGCPAEETDVIRRIEGPLEVKQLLFFLYARDCMSLKTRADRVRAIQTIIRPGGAFDKLTKIVEQETDVGMDRLEYCEICCESWWKAMAEMT
jgi:hypothetical protein